MRGDKTRGEERRGEERRVENMDREDNDEDRRTTMRIAVVAVGSMWCALLP